MTQSALSELSDEVLHCEVKRLAGRANTLLAELLAHLVRALAGPIREMQAGIAAGQAPPAASPESNADLSGSAPPSIGAGRPIPPRQSANSGPRYRVQFTADQAYVDLLEEARDLLQHSIPGRDLVEVQRRALQELVKKLRARKLAAAKRPRAPNPSPADPSAPKPADPTPAPAPCSANEDTSKHDNAAPGRRYVPAAVRRTVWQRDEDRCTYHDARGQRCRERAGLQVHHLAPHARGGPATIDNLTLRCRAHNALAAEEDFGREWILQKIAIRASAKRRKCQRSRC